MRRLPEGVKIRLLLQILVFLIYFSISFVSVDQSGVFQMSSEPENQFDKHQNGWNGPTSRLLESRLPSLSPSPSPPFSDGGSPAGSPSIVEDLGGGAMRRPETGAAAAEEDFRRRLKYYFMNPCEKYQARGRKPWKLMLQILKIALITAQVRSGIQTAAFPPPDTWNTVRFFQLVSFGLSNEMMVTFRDDSLATFRHLFLKGYRDHRPGSYALYTKPDVYDHVDFVIRKVPTFRRTAGTEPPRTLTSVVFSFSTSISKT